MLGVFVHRSTHGGNRRPCARRREWGSNFRSRRRCHLPPAGRVQGFPPRCPVSNGWKLEEGSAGLDDRTVPQAVKVFDDGLDEALAAVEVPRDSPVWSPGATQILAAAVAAREEASGLPVEMESWGDPSVGLGGLG